MRIPPHQANVRYTHKYRYFVTEDQDGTLFRSTDFASAQYALNTNGLTSYGSSVFQSYHIKSIEMWAAAAPGSQATVSWTWYDGLNNTAATEISDTSISPFYPAHIIARPPNHSYSQLTSTSFDNQYIGAIVCPAGTVVDVTLDVVMEDGLALYNALPVGTYVGTQGTVYAGYLDSSAHSVGSRKFVPVGLKSLG